MEINFKEIGTIHTPFETREGMPVQSVQANGIKGQVVVKEELVAGLTDLDGFSHIILIYHFHKSFFDNKTHGVFATRAPKRPNPIGMSVVRLLSVEKNVLTIENVDMLDGTPLLDIKPYIADFDIHPSEKSGWIGNKREKLNSIKSDKRFE